MDLTPGTSRGAEQMDPIQPHEIDMLGCVRHLLITISALLIGCASPPPPPEAVKPDPVTEAWYGQTVTDLAALNREAEILFHSGKGDAASELVQKGQVLAGRLLAAPRPSLPAMEAASDLDDLYGRMLLANSNVGWARLQFQKNVGRWKNWRPQTEETAKRRKQAEQRIAECDRRLAQ
jgi:hypothetical protein